MIIKAIKKNYKTYKTYKIYKIYKSLFISYFFIPFITINWSLNLAARSKSNSEAAVFISSSKSFISILSSSFGIFLISVAVLSYFLISSFF